MHNLNTMHSRAGAQIPFSSLNYGMDTSPEGRLVIRSILMATDAGLGNGETAISVSYTHLLYISNTLGVSDAVVGYVPLVRAAILLLFMFGVQHWINSLPYKPVMIIGLLIYIVGFVSLILARESLIGLYIYIPLEAVAYAFVMPRKDALLTLFVDKHDRSKVFGMLYVIVLGVSAPFGSIIGALSDSNQVYPCLLYTSRCV